ncbi:ubiquitin carboxyl-terminal hydrolase 29-like [Silurus meridionalis]|nr:ubiquitin carboxyl-terminal hydrolase 29-like [Silurus meridionalis]
MMFSMFSSPRLWWKKNKYEYIPPSEPLPSTGSDTKTPREPSGTSEKFTGKGKDEAKKVFKWDFRKKNLVDSPADSNKNKENSVAASLGVAQEKLYEKTNEFRKSVEDGNACRSKTMVSDRKINSTTLTVYPITKSHLLTTGLPNLGKTCYCNASLQFLFTANAFCRELSDIIDNYNDRLEVQFIRFFVMLWKIRNNLEGEEVCSKVDCLLGLFNAVSDANPIFKLRKGNSARKFIWQCLKQIKTSTKMLGWKKNADPRCPIKSNFIIKMKKVMKCSRCSFEEDQFKFFHYIIVPLFHKSLDLCLSKALSLKFLDKCKKCENRTVRYFWTFHTLPRFLILHLQRFISSKNRKLIKLDHPVIIKSQLNINVSAFSKNGRINRKCISQSAPKTPKPQKGNSKAEARKKTRKELIGSTSTYRLISILSHIGDLPQIGHFVTDCISPNPPQWVNYNDEDVTLTTEEDVLKERSTCASVFLYEKVSTDETILLNG